MSERTLALLLAAGLAGVSVCADYLLKLASQHEHSASSHWFWLGISVYACMGVGWVIVMRQLSFAEIGIVYSVTSILLLMLVGVVGLKETLHVHEMLGAAMAIGSIFMLARFA